MSINRRSFALGSLLFALSGCSSDDAPEGGITIGLLLPFTGSASATASNMERATLYAADRINKGGGIDGQKVRIVARDTHSDLVRGREAAEELAAQGVVAIIGPESAEIAQDIRPRLAAAGVLFLSPLIGAAEEPSRMCDTPWFRLAPSAKTLGEALAKQANTKSVKRAAVLYSSSPYDRALGASVAARFHTLGGEVALQLQLNPNAQSYASVVSAAIDAGVTDVILAASPRAAAILINEFDALSREKPRWFLSPLLKTDLLVQNVAPQALEAALGVAPKIYDHGDEFPLAFSKRWEGDQPLEGAYFYYDAMSLLALALAKVAADPSGKLTLNAAMLDAAGPPGEGVGWDELDTALERLSEGDDLYYTGLTGPLSLENCGSRTGVGAAEDWTVREGVILDLAK
ncbi:MAG: amino acid ABC transporter substrate-binding protein [Myxococcales bacterium]|nr:MAG: amino acid ABC transporter substrate-binding protein [Myxococcales bacterium]